jgi:hypothetical protein
MLVRKTLSCFAVFALAAAVISVVPWRFAYSQTRPAETSLRAVVDGIVVQPLRLIAPDNSVLVALYTMEKEKDGRWKIAGCVLAPTTVRAA